MLTLEKYPIRMSYSINTLFWLDDIGVPHQKAIIVYYQDNKENLLIEETVVVVIVW